MASEVVGVEGDGAVGEVVAEVDLEHHRLGRGLRRGLAGRRLLRDLLRCGRLPDLDQRVVQQGVGGAVDRDLHLLVAAEGLDQSPALVGAGPTGQRIVAHAVVAEAVVGPPPVHGRILVHDRTTLRSHLAVVREVVDVGGLLLGESGGGEEGEEGGDGVAHRVLLCWCQLNPEGERRRKI